MKPLDIINTNLDLREAYSSGVYCDIIDCNPIKNVGVILKVRILRTENINLVDKETLKKAVDEEDVVEAYTKIPSNADLEKETILSVICVNLSEKENPNNIVDKYYAYVMPTRKGKLQFAPALLVPKTLFDLEQFKPDTIEKLKATQGEIILDKKTL